MIPALLLAALASSPPVAQAARGQGAVGQAQIEAAIERGVGHLLEVYGLDPSGKGLEPGAQAGILGHPGLHALALYTLVAAGVEAEHPVVRAMLARLAFERFETTYDASCMLLALAVLGPREHGVWMRDLGADLLAWQEPRGDWGYPGGGDLSNAQFAALGLQALARSGVEAPAQAWSRLAGAVIACAAPDGGFGYVPPGRRASGSMTVAGIGTLALCELQLARAGLLEEGLAARIRAARAAGEDWLARYFDVEHNPRASGWLHYYLYGLERMGAFAGLERVGGHDWYAEGAAALVRAQHGDGSWSGTFEREPTIFALLFLRRASAPPAPTTGGAAAGNSATGDPDSAQAAAPTVRLGALAGAPAKLWLRPFPRALARELEWPGEAGLGPRVTHVEYVSEGRVVAAALGDPRRPAGARAFLAEHLFTTRGRRTVSARVHVLAPPAGAADGAAGVARVLLSNAVELELDATHAPQPWLLEYRPARNLLAGARARASASSEHAAPPALPARAYAPEYAVDDNARTPWIAAADDPRPSLLVTLRRPLRADTLRLRPARRFAPDGPPFEGPRTAELRVGRGPWRPLELPHEPERPLDVDLGGALLVRTLELRFDPGDGLAGVAELELWLAEE